MPTTLRAAYGSFSSNRTRVRNTWALAAMENAFLKDIGINRVEIDFPLPQLLKTCRKVQAGALSAESTPL